MKTFTLKQRMVLPLFLLLWLLTGCIATEHISASPTISSSTGTALIPTPSFTVTQTLSTALPTLTAMSAEDYARSVRSRLGLDDQCPRFCWLGINPGVTTVEDARVLLKSSNQINQDTISETETEIKVDWENDPVDITIEGGLVKEISISVVNFGLGISNFFTVIGEPDEISIRIYPTPDCPILTYDLYYSSHKLGLTVPYGSWDGPNPQNAVWTLTLNTEFDTSDRQPWLGYGHMQDYFPGQAIPTGPCNP